MIVPASVYAVWGDSRFLYFIGVMKNGVHLFVIESRIFHSFTTTTLLVLLFNRS